MDDPGEWGRLGPPLYSIERWRIERLRLRHTTDRAMFYQLRNVREWQDRVMDSMVHELEALVLTGPTKKIQKTVTYEVPATWWDAFKLEAITWGNPFFDPAKVRYRRVAMVVEWRYKEVFPQGGTFALSDDQVQRGVVEFVVDRRTMQEDRDFRTAIMDFDRFRPSPSAVAAVADLLDEANRKDGPDV